SAPEGRGGPGRGAHRQAGHHQPEAGREGEGEEGMTPEAGFRLRHKHLLGIEPLEPEEIRLILDTAEAFLEVSQRPIKKVPTLRGRTIVNFFMEPSTRTRSSFEIAEKRLSADSLNFSPSGSSVSKG